jgi:ubiquinone/menaquinone biosynthesis C-methylase UbiE
MSETHAKRVLDAFSAQAEAFEDARFNRLFTLDAEWLFERLDCRADDLLLDVAAGTGHAARSLAPRVRVAVAIDLTPAMLAAGSAAAREQGIENVIFALGDATRLPFLDGTFDVVVSRFALHHMPEAALAVEEMTRCLRPGGRLAIADMIAEENPELASAQNRLERLRDPSHTTMLAPSTLSCLISEAGLVDMTSEARTIDRPLEPWLEQAQTGIDVAGEIRGALRAEIAGASATGMHPYERDGELRFLQRWASTLARKPAG